MFQNVPSALQMPWESNFRQKKATEQIIIEGKSEEGLKVSREEGKVFRGVGIGEGI